MTENEDLNQLVVQRWNKVLDDIKLYYWSSEEGRPQEHSGLRQAGQSVWTDLDLKSILAGNAQQNTLFTCSITVDLESFSKGKEMLLCMHSGEIFPYIPTEKKGEATFLTLRPINSGLEKSTNMDWIIFSNDKTLEDLYGKMLDRLKSHIFGLKKEKLLSELMKREREYSSLIGHNVSLPHTYTNDIDRSILLLAKVEPPIICCHTAAEIKLVFMVLSPEERPEEHLGHLSRIAKFIGKEETRASILEAKSPAEVYEIVEKG